MSKLVQTFLIVAVSLCFSGWANATLIGDTVTIGRYINGDMIGDGSCCGPFDVMVEAGSGDRTAVSTGNNFYVDVETDRVRIEFGPQRGDGGSIIDHEILIEGLDWVDDPTGFITGFSLITNFSSITESLFRFDDHLIGLQVGSLRWTGGESYFAEAVIETNHAVPEPSILTLMGLGLAGLGLARHRMKA